jgi:hypothetical protein
MTEEFNKWWDNDLLTEENPYVDGTPAFWAWEGWCAAVKVEREAISDEWHSSVYSDLEHGVKCLNEQAAKDWYKNYPEIAKFGAWLEARSCPPCNEDCDQGRSCPARGKT